MAKKKKTAVKGAQLKKKTKSDLANLQKALKSMQGNLKKVSQDVALIPYRYWQ